MLKKPGNACYCVLSAKMKKLKSDTDSNNGLSVQKHKWAGQKEYMHPKIRTNSYSYGTLEKRIYAY